MALIKCPECGKEISNKASACIHCGYPLESAQPEVASVHTTAQSQSSVDLDVKSDNKPEITNDVSLEFSTGSSGENTVSGKQSNSDESGCLGWLIFVGIIVGIGMFLLTSGFSDFTLWWCVFPLAFAAFILVGMIYSFATAEPGEIKNSWDAEKYNYYKFTCPMCGSKKVKKIGTVNRAASVAAVGLASSKIGKQYECDACKHKW